MARMACHRRHCCGRLLGVLRTGYHRVNPPSRLVGRHPRIHPAVDFAFRRLQYVLAAGGEGGFPSARARRIGRRQSRWPEQFGSSSYSRAQSARG